MDKSERYNCSTRLQLLSLDEQEEKCSTDSIWIKMKVRIRDLRFEDEGQLKLDLSMLKQMLQDHLWRVPLYDILSEINVPVDIQSSVAHDILIQLSFLVIAPEIITVGGDKVLHMAVSIDIFHYNEPEFGAVSIVLIASLEKAKVEVSTMCSICSEEMMVGSEATRMRCSHLYHGDCILDWLHKNRFCQLCHFAKNRLAILGE